MSSNPLSLYGVTERCSGVLRHVLLFDRARSNTPDSPTTETVLTRRGQRDRTVTRYAAHSS